jgi:hypothetical protein
VSEPVQLARYDAMRQQVAECARIDEAAQIRDKAAAIAAYARQRDDTELAVWASEIRLRACQRIGQLSADLEQSKGGKNPKATLLSGEKSKSEALALAGISVPTAHRYEEVAGGRTEQMRDVASTAAVTYFAKAQADQVPGTMEGLRGAIRASLREVFGEPEPKPPRKTAPPPEPVEQDWPMVVHAIRQLAECRHDLARLASFIPPLLIPAHMDRCSAAIEMLMAFNDALAVLERNNAA